MEDDLEDYSGDYHSCEHDGAGELCPLEGDKMYSVVLSAIMLSMMVRFE